MSTRRGFLCLSSAAFAGAAASRLFAQREGTPVFSNASLGAYTQGTLTRARFQSLVGQPFRIFLEHSKVADVRLLSVTPAYSTTPATAASSQAAPANRAFRDPNVLQPKPSGSAASKVKRPAPDQAFAMTFGTGATVVPQDSYVLDHATLGSFAAFLVPGKDDQGSNTCTAAFYYMN